MPTINKRSITCYHVGTTVIPLLSGHLRDLPKRSLNRGRPVNKVCKNCAMFVNDQYSTVTLNCDKVACCLRYRPEFKFITLHYIF